MSTPGTHEAQLAAWRQFMALLREKALPIVLAEQQGQSSPTRRPRADEGKDQAPDA